MPDLVVWCAKRGICKFVEVKGPGDRPQENQKVGAKRVISSKCH